MSSDLVRPTPSGLFCEPGNFYVDPWKPVTRAIVTHAHADHARAGSGYYLCSESGEGVLRHRIGKASAIETLPWAEKKRIGDTTVSLHPAGHLLGSAQVRIEYKGEVWVISGDYKTAPDRSCETFEPVPCDTFITESTFGLPVYRWPDPESVFTNINRWWQNNSEAGQTSVLFAYALGKAQRILCGIDPAIGPILVHGSVEPFLPHYRKQGRPIPETLPASPENAKAHKGRALVIAPASARNTTWMRKFSPVSTAAASGWMQIRGNRRREALDRGFVLSDHADWVGLLAAIDATGAERIGVTHGFTGPLVRWLKEDKGVQAWEIPTRFVGEAPDDTGNPEA